MLIKNLIRQATRVGSSESIAGYIEYLYQFEKFKNTLNLTLSLIKQDRLSFEIYKEGSVDIEEGLCKTIQSSSANKYIIVLRRSNPYIIIHELSHMVEKELNLNLAQEFLHKVYQDVEQNLKQSNILVKTLSAGSYLRRYKLIKLQNHAHRNYLLAILSYSLGHRKCTPRIKNI
ncbi:MAG: hypothetical protein PG981_001249 [Wolbachia endosymbiont of Ctenocephalides orientis wCori]|nr:MAG: hypothetical protein PG981_001249 [Wolbachia endosymbiont of Ctenocephalides orientis wCori]